jgi:KUP system potassium uptake protein
VVRRCWVSRKANSVIVNRRAAARAALALGALGVVFGDIGTSPLYTVETVFNPADPHPVRVSTESIFGVVSLIFWSVTVIVTVTYVLLVMRADNDGEGGIMALITLISRRASLAGGGQSMCSPRWESSGRRCSSATA